jgi:hypothetical protein
VLSIAYDVFGAYCIIHSTQITELMFIIMQVKSASTRGQHTFGDRVDQTVTGSLGPGVIYPLHLGCLLRMGFG